MNANVSNIKDHAADAFDKAKAAATSPKVVEGAKEAAKYVGLGACVYTGMWLASKVLGG